MKKLLLFFLLAVTFNLSAQTFRTTYFAKPLELNNVPASTSTSDSVIVRGADNILKFVPRSEFGSGGGSQNLQQILDQSKYAQYDSGHTFVNIMEGTPDNRYTRFFNGTGGNKVTDLSLYTGFASLTSNDGEGYTRTLKMGVDNSEFSLTKSRAGYGSLVLKFPDLVTGSAFLVLPDKADGLSHTIATLDDITAGSQNLQQTLNFGKLAEYDGGNSSINLIGDNSTENERYIDFSIGNGTENTSFSLSNNVTTLYGGNSTNTAYVQVLYGKILLVEQNSTSGGSTSFNLPAIPTNNVDFELPTLNSNGLAIIPVKVNNSSSNSAGNINIVKGEFSNNTAAIAAGLQDGDIYNLPVSGDNYVLAIVKNP